MEKLDKSHKFKTEMHAPPQNDDSQPVDPSPRYAVLPIRTSDRTRGDRMPIGQNTDPVRSGEKGPCQPQTTE
jgi:hypothetical protein